MTYLGTKRVLWARPRKSGKSTSNEAEIAYPPLLGGRELGKGLTRQNEKTKSSIWSAFLASFTALGAPEVE